VSALAGLAARLGAGPRLPAILQTEAAECGLACLAMVAGYHGLKTDLGSLRREHGSSLRGATLARLMAVAQRLGLGSRALRLEPAELVQLRTPAILHWNLNHFVVLEAVRAGRVLVRDPSVGRRALGLEMASRHFTGVALELWPAADFAPRDARERLLRGLTGLKAFLARLLVLSLALQAVALLSPFYVQLVVDEAVVRLDHGFLTLLAAGFGLVLLLGTLLGWIRAWVLAHAGTLLGLQAQSALLGHLLRLPIGFFHKRHVGDIVSRFGSLSAIQGLVTTGVVAALIDGMMLLLTLGVMLAYEWRLAGLALAVAAAYGLMRWARYAALRDLSVESLVAAAESGSQFIETLRGMATIKGFSLELERLGQWQNRAVDLANTGLRIARLDLAFDVASKLLFGAAGIAVVYLGAVMVMEQALTIGMLMAFLAYQGQFLGAAGGLINQWVAWRLLDVHLDRLADIALCAPEEPRPAADLPRGAAPRAALALDRIAFRHAPEDPLLLEDLSLEVPEGACVVITGPSGSGKSTLLRLARGLERPERGAVRCGGVDVAKIGLANYRRMVAAVTQEDSLLAGSIAENITLFDAQPDLERMVDCATRCRVHDAIMAMPMNYHSRIGEMGDTLSAGERQRLMLARALYRQPRILLLDEATSHLDPELDEQVNAMLAGLAITRLVVSHRRTCLPWAHAAYRLAGGRLEPLPRGD
jgi:ATP-binding cassette, subfamily B, bacterial CvaB/MchF/RaxB